MQMSEGISVEITDPEVSDVPLSNVDIQEIGSVGVQEDAPASLKVVTTSLTSSKSPTDIGRIESTSHYCIMTVFYIVLAFFTNVCLRRGFPAFLKRYPSDSKFATKFPRFYAYLERTNEALQKNGGRNLDAFIIWGSLIISVLLLVLTWNVWKLVSIVKSLYALYKHSDPSNRG